MLNIFDFKGTESDWKKTRGFRVCVQAGAFASSFQIKFQQTRKLKEVNFSKLRTHASLQARNLANSNKKTEFEIKVPVENLVISQTRRILSSALDALGYMLRLEQSRKFEVALVIFVWYLWSVKRADAQRYAFRTCCLLAFFLHENEVTRPLAEAFFCEIGFGVEHSPRCLISYMKKIHGYKSIKVQAHVWEAGCKLESYNKSPGLRRWREFSSIFN